MCVCLYTQVICLPLWSVRLECEQSYEGADVACLYRCPSRASHTVSCYKNIQKREWISTQETCSHLLFPHWNIQWTIQCLFKESLILMMMHLKTALHKVFTYCRLVLIFANKLTSSRKGQQARPARRWHLRSEMLSWWTSLQIWTGNQRTGISVVNPNSVKLLYVLWPVKLQLWFFLTFLESIDLNNKLNKEWTVSPETRVHILCEAKSSSTFVC